LIHLTSSAPDTVAANIFPQAAGANKSVFYRADGTPKTVREVYDWALKQPSVGGAPASAPPTTATAVTYSTVDSIDYADLIASMWTQSATGFFPSGSGEGSSSRFLLTPGVLDILSSPVAKTSDDS